MIIFSVIVLVWVSLVREQYSARLDSLFRYLWKFALDLVSACCVAVLSISCIMIINDRFGGFIVKPIGIQSEVLEKFNVSSFKFDQVPVAGKKGVSICSFYTIIRKTTVNHEEIEHYDFSKVDHFRDCKVGEMAYMKRIKLQKIYSELTHLVLFPKFLTPFVNFLTDSIYYELHTAKGTVTELEKVKT